MSDIGRLRGQLAVLEARRLAHLENAQHYREIAERSRADRDNPPDPTRTYEHQRAMDLKAQRMEGEAVRSQREAEFTLTEMRGIQSELAHRTRTER